MSYKNPLLTLPSAARLAELPDDAKEALRAVLRDIGRDAEEKAQSAWSTRKGPMAAYWMAVGVNARHIARLPQLQPRAFVRDAEFECADYERGDVAPAPQCETDGHHLCAGCRWNVHRIGAPPVGARP